ncbi:MAG: uridine monophosphate kinase [Candidatus Brocadiaceae bacterium]|jgi:uridylate kinase
MANEPAPQRVLLKLSGNVFSATDCGPFEEEALRYIAEELEDAAAASTQIAAVVGGGNVIRGARFCPDGSGRILADYAGMLATVINSLLLRNAMQSRGMSVTHYGAFAIPRMVEVFEPECCIRDMEEGKLVLLAGGTGNPLLTTDTAAALRAVEIGADLLLKATRVEGVYSADPEQDPEAELFRRISYRDVLERKLGVMDLAAVSLCMEHRLPVRVFDFGVKGNIRRAATGEPVGTLIGSDGDAR